ncbi:hypothetical protein, partial [Sutterella wadsworthensis]|uniref:hypothetical protein n=1 Tax=Sutterella wadsworthensis TaxID=40545 RepID=UPI00241C7188
AKIDADQYKYGSAIREFRCLRPQPLKVAAFFYLRPNERKGDIRKNRTSPLEGTRAVRRLAA